MAEVPERLRAALADRYDIGEQLGEGGMATVYLANDIKHDRKVAIKVLRPELAAVIGGDRFIAEIRTTASLQHPHILPLFDSGEADSFLYYVMPYVEGESLRDRLDRDKQLPVEEAVRITRAIGSALHYAHERDIVHRDIKPANILMHAGEPIVADFGIAIAISAAGGGRLTETGMSVGTPHYMSPEQASADRDVDARSDTYALACVLYEMLAGAPPHTGPSAQAVLMRILTETPRAITDVRRSVPQHVGSALSKGLEKLAADRFGSAKEFSDALDDSSFSYHPVVVDATVQALPARRVEIPTRKFNWALPVAAVMTMATVSLLLRGSGEALPELPTTRLTFDQQDIDFYRTPIVQVSRDGSRFFINGDRGDEIGIFVRTADEEQFRLIDDTEACEFVAFSPDGEWVAYSNSDGSIHRAPFGGGASRMLKPEGGANPPAFLSWGDDGSILYVDRSAEGGSAVMRLPESGGEPTKIFESDVFIYKPSLLPGGKAILYSDGESVAVWVHDLEADSSWELVPNGSGAEYLPTGHIVYGDRSGGIWALAFDPRKLEALGEPIPVMTGVDFANGFAPVFSISHNGTLTYQTGGVADGGLLEMERLVVVDLDGDVTELPIDRRRFRSVRWSPDGRSVAFSALEPGEANGRTSIYTYNIELRTATRRLTEEGTQGFPVWSPDGSEIAFADAVAALGPDPRQLGAIATADIRVIDAEGVEQRWIRNADEQDIPYAWLSGNRVVFAGGDVNSSDLITTDASGAEGDAEYLNVDADLGALTMSPDESWIAFNTNESGAREIAVRSFPNPGAPIAISQGGGDRPRWSRDGRSIFYWKSASAMDSLMVARVRVGAEFELLSTELVLTGNYNLSTWDLHPDGDRFIVSQGRTAAQADAAEERPEPVQRIAMNWFTELRAATSGGN